MSVRVMGEYGYSNILAVWLKILVLKLGSREFIFLGSLLIELVILFSLYINNRLISLRVWRKHLGYSTSIYSVCVFVFFEKAPCSKAKQ